MSITGTAAVGSPMLTSTASMQADTEAHQVPDAASASFLQRFPIEDARCATQPTDMEWVPAREQRVVPEAMMALCVRCPGRTNCLKWALAEDLDGYWAATTRADRAQMRYLQQETVEAADDLQAIQARQAFEAHRAHQGLADAGRLHDAGEGSLWWYRRSCRCGECKSANTAARAQERARARAAA